MRNGILLRFLRWVEGFMSEILNFGKGGQCFCETVIFGYHVALEPVQIPQTLSLAEYSYYLLVKYLQIYTW